MVGCGVLEVVAIGLAMTELFEAKHKTILPIAALILGFGPLALVLATLLTLRA